MSKHNTLLPEKPDPAEEKEATVPLVSDEVGDASAAEADPVTESPASESTAAEAAETQTDEKQTKKSVMPLTGPVLRRTLWREWRGSLLTFCFASIYTEMCLHFCIYKSIDSRILYPILFAAIAGCVFSLISSSLPKIPGRIMAVLLLAVSIRNFKLRLE